MKRAQILIAVVTTTMLGLLLLISVGAQTPEPVDTAAIDKIKAAGKVTPQVMEMATYITNTYGMRLTNSASVKAAGEYARRKLVEWKLTGVEVQTFNFGNGWSNDRLSLKLASDPTATFQAYSKPWTQGTTGPITGDVVEGVRSQADLTSMKGKLKGKFVLVLPPQAPGPSGAVPPLKRFTDAELASMSTGAPTAAPTAAPAATGPAPAGPITRGQAGNRGAAAPAPEPPPAEEAGAFAFLENALSAAPAVATNAAPAPRGANAGAAMPSRTVVTRFYFDEGVAGMIEPTQTRFGAMFSILETGETVPWKKDTKLTKTPPQIVMAVDDYNKLTEKVQKASPVSLTADIKNTYRNLEADQLAFNVVGEIKGTDKADELVVLGAQLDTVNLGKGATDNAAGVAIVMEAVRLLKAANLPMRRTVRIGLWTAGEQGALGSMAFVDKHFFLRPIRQLKPGHAKLNAYFNMNGGTGAIRGVFLQGNTQVKPIFEAWLGPFTSMGMTTLADRNSPIVSDHISFDNIGLPGFMFIQDPIHYDAVTRHSTLDTVDKLIKEDLEKNAAIVAGWVYLAANRAEMLPRKPLPRGVYPAGAPVP